MWCAVRMKGGFLYSMRLFELRIVVVSRFSFEVSGAEAVGGAEFKFRKGAPCKVYRLVYLRIY
jgi:hypothetical protein